MPVETLEVVFSFDQPADARHPLLSLLQQLRNHPLAKNSRAGGLLNSQRVLIIDSRQERAQFIAQLLVSAGYRPFVAQSSLDAYTLFLQGTFHPFAIILSEESAVKNQLFLTRLAQQFIQRYDWRIPFLRLSIPAGNFSGAPSTEPLTRGSFPPRSPTIPLNRPRGTSSSAPLSPSVDPSTPRLPGQPFSRSQQRPDQATGRSSSPGQPGPSAPLRTPMPAIPATPVPGGPASAPLSLDDHQSVRASLENLNLGHYQIKSLLGSNPLGDVYLAYDRLHEQDVALKTLQTHLVPTNLLAHLGDNDNLFQPEFDLLASAEHPYLAHPLDIGSSYVGKFRFMYKIMPYYPEGSLANWLARSPGKTFSPADVVYVILQTADAIQFLHNRGFLYQNFKMTNLLVVNKARTLREMHIMVTDLPFVQDVINLPKKSEHYCYYAPEQWENEAFTSSDQYSLAVLAYELLTGHTPFQGEGDVVAHRLRLALPVPAPSSFNKALPAALDRVMLRALAKHPAERFESISAFATALERATK